MDSSLTWVTEGPYLILPERSPSANDPQAYDRPGAVRWADRFPTAEPTDLEGRLQVCH